MRWFLPFLICITGFIFFVSCAKEDVGVKHDTHLEVWTTPPDFPDMVFPEENSFSPNRWRLGKKLFYDNRLSIDSSISCGTCHQQKFGFSDQIALTPGVLNRPAKRNSPTLTNIGYNPYFTREGGVSTLEKQILVPISEHNEFGFNMVLLIERLKDDKEYQKMAMEAYGRALDAFTITRAISNFERSLISGNSRYDKYNRGNKSVLTETELEGLNLFFSDRTNCSLCHGGFNFTNYSFSNNGLYQDYTDLGRYLLTGKDMDKSLFKTPSLRNIGVTSPYMHDGSIEDLEQVINHYNSGGKNHPNKSHFIKPLGLSKEEKAALKAFLLTLDDPEFLNNKQFAE